MDELTIGIPRAIYYYYYGDMVKAFFRKLKIKFVISPLTNQKIVNEGIKYANDEMCLSLKVLLGHIKYLEDKCDYIVVPRIVNYGKKDQTCTNFLSLYDLINNLFNVKVIEFNIDYLNNETEKKAFIKLGKFLKKKNINEAYLEAKREIKNRNNKQIYNNLEKLKSSKTKVLLIGHPYNIYDDFIGKPIINLLKDMDVEVIDCNKFDKSKTNVLASYFSPNLYWKFSKENIGSIRVALNRIDGILFLTAFPCGLDSLVNELVLRKVNKPMLNLIIDDNDSLTGVETRIESFIDIIENRN